MLGYVSLCQVLGWAVGCSDTCDHARHLLRHWSHLNSFDTAVNLATHKAEEQALGVYDKRTLFCAVDAVSSRDRSLIFSRHLWKTLVKYARIGVDMCGQRGPITVQRGFT